MAGTEGTDLESSDGAEPQRNRSAGQSDLEARRDEVERLKKEVTRKRIENENPSMTATNSHDKVSPKSL